MNADLKNFLISTAGSAITMYIAYIWKFRHLFEKNNFRNQKSAEKEILNDLKKSKSIRVYAMCGSTFSDTTNSNIAKAALKDMDLNQFYLVSDKENMNIGVRQRELPRGSTDLQTKVINSLNEFATAKKSNSKIEFRLHKNKVGFRLIILDNCLYLSQQEKDKYGKDTPIQRISSGTPAYQNFLAYFTKLWDDNNL